MREGARARAAPGSAAARGAIRIAWSRARARGGVARAGTRGCACASRDPPMIAMALLVSLAGVVCAGDPHYAFDDYTNLLPLPNHHTNGTTLLVLPTKLNWTWTGPGVQPEVLAAATRRYNGVIFAWGAPTVKPSSSAPTLTHVDLNVDNPDDSYKTLQLGMDESYTLDVPTTGTATIRAPTVWGALRALETLAQMIEYHPNGPPMGAQGNKMEQPWGSQVDAHHQKEYTLAWAPWHVADAPRF